MATSKSSWGMEIGADAIKAIRLERDGDRVIVSDFAVVPHKKVLTTPDLDQDEMIRLSLGQFISQKSLEGEHLVMSVPGHAAFARFAKLPPVEPKKVPDIVKFEAVQQIPFPIEDVEWDYQTFTADDSPEIEVGIFAITRERVQQRLSLYGELGISPESLTLSPVSVFNAMSYDLNLADRPEPVILLDIGTQATDVIIAEEGRCWIRTFPLGGTHFTEAIASAFKLSYTKAEKLKRTASTSKYAKQIMQAMRPVFSDLLQDLQRSIGYYQSLHREHDLTMMVGIGSTFKIPGLRKFIGQQLQIDVVRLDEFRRIAVTGREASAFAENAVNMATAYGLALQGVGLAPIDANLVPVKALREQMWHSKTKWFAAAAAVIVAGAATTLYHPITDRGKLDAAVPSRVTDVLARGKKIKEQFDEAQQKVDVGFTAENMRRLTDYRNVWPNIISDVSAAVASTDPQATLLGEDVEAIENVPPKDRLVSLEQLAGDYVPPGEGRIIQVTMHVELSHDEPIKFLNENVAKWLRENAEPEGDRGHVPYRILPETVSCNPAALTRIEIDGSGARQTRGGERLERPRGPSRPGESSGSTGRKSGGAKRPPPGAMSPGGGSTPGFGGQSGPGRRKSTEKRRPPGAMAPGGGGTPGFTSGGGSRPGLSSPTAPRRDDPAGGGDDPKQDEPDAIDLDTMAPMPDPPALYPRGASLYQVPITFDVEIIDPQTKMTPKRTAQASSDERRGS